MTDILNRRLAPSLDAATSAVGDETVILHLTSGTYFGLDEVGTKIWTMLKNEVQPSEICRQIADEFGIDQSVVEADARRFLSELESQGIIVER